VSWSLTASHEVGPTTVLQEGTYSVEASEDGTTPTDEGSGTQGDAAERRGGATWIVLGIVLIALISSVGTAMLIRGSDSIDIPETKLDENDVSEAIWIDVEEHPGPEQVEDPEATTYHDGLLEQGYGPEDALAYTRQYFPDFRC